MSTLSELEEDQDSGPNILSCQTQVSTTRHEPRSRIAIEADILVV
jgi:hypothetical protein